MKHGKRGDQRSDTDSSFGIPAIYRKDWPDRFIHTNLDSAVNIDATKLKRAGFIGAASGYFLANLQETNAEGLKPVFETGRHRRVSEALSRREALPGANLGDYPLVWTREEQRMGGSLLPFLSKPLVESLEAYYGVSLAGNILNPWKAIQPLPRGDGVLRFQRKAQPRGPMAAFGFDYFEVEWAKRGHTSQPKLLEYDGLWGGREEYAYEVLNLADGKRNAQEIRDAVSAEYGPVALEEIGWWRRAS